MAMEIGAIQIPGTDIGAVQSSITTITDNIDLFINGMDSLINSLNLFINGFTSLTDNINLIITGHEIFTDNLDLFINGFDVINNNTELFIDGKDNKNQNIDLFIKGYINPVNFYVIASGGNNNNGGSSEGSPKAFGTGAATIAGVTVTLSVDSPDLSSVVVNDTIRLDGRTDGYGGSPQNDIFVIVAIDNILKTVDVTPTPNSITSGVTWAIGGAFSTLRRGIRFCRPNDKCYVKGSFTGQQDMTDVGFPGGIPATPIIIEGYSVTPGDEGMAVFDGENTASNGLWLPGITTNLFLIIKNIRVTRYTTGFNDTYGGWPMQFINCRADHCNTGFLAAHSTEFINCYAHDNSIVGFTGGENCEFFGCIINNNGKGVLFGCGIKSHRCLFYANTTHNIHITGASNSDPTFIVDSIIDGDGISDYGVFGFSHAGYIGDLKILNSMIINCDVGIHILGDDGTWDLNAGLLVHGNTIDFENYIGQLGLVSGTPIFVNEGIDWTPANGSAAIMAGWDLRTNKFAVVAGVLPTIGGIEPGEL